MDYTIGNINFKDLADEDFGRLNNFLLENISPIAGYSPNSLFAWNKVYDYGWTFLSDMTLLIACCRCIEDGCSLLCPVGEFPPKDQQALVENIMKEKRPVKVLAVNENFLEDNPGFIRNFTVTEDRNQYNYVYSASDLAELPGGKYKKKRNHIHQAEGAYQWTVEEIKTGHIAECIDFLELAYRETVNSYSDPSDVPPGLMNERIVLNYALENFSRPGNRGVIIRVNGKIAAFSVYEIIMHRGGATAQVHFEKALRSMKGLYQVINHETAKIIFKQGVNLINREEDLGDPGLRKAKASYYPSEMIRAWNLESIIQV
jgi:hypothetical protein